MKNIICLFFLVSAISTVFAQNLTISFQPKVSSTPIDSVQATNLKTNQIVKLFGSESLVLVKTTSSINLLSDKIEKGYIYPNPTNENAIFYFSTDKSQQAELRLYNAKGQLLYQKKQNLMLGTHRFELKFPVAGIYLVSLLESNESGSYKVVYTGKTIQNSSISYIGNEKLNSRISNLNQLKGATTDKTLTYTDGDVIQYSVSSVENTTIITEIPTVSKTFDVDFVSCKDIDNKSYKVVKIGSQWWMAENLAYLPSVNPSTAGSLSAPFYYVYDYTGTDVAVAKKTAKYRTYGVLYNWPAAIAACPQGWHLPSDAEWSALTTFLGGEIWAGGKLKENGNSHWLSPNTGATNETGFAALPAGSRYGPGFSLDVGYLGMCWSSTEDGANSAWDRTIYTDEGTIISESFSYENGLSVRCVRNSEILSSQDVPISDFLVSTSSITNGQRVQFTDKSTNNPTSWLWDFGDTSLSIEQYPWHTYNTPGIYTVSLKATNNNGGNTKTLTNYINVIEGNNGSAGTLVYAGKTYQTITINGKEWMAENLAYLPVVSPPSSSDSSTTDPHYYVYCYNGTDVAAAKLTANYSTYGVLYNWPAAMTACPPGWHLPSKVEWSALTTFLGGEGVVGGILKESGYTHWLSPNTGATNEIGFSALPAGSFNGGWFNDIGYYGYWWSSTEYDAGEAWLLCMHNHFISVFNGSFSKQDCFSVRCIRD